MSLGAEGLFAEPRTVEALEDCFYYHTMNVPGHGLVEGEWDLRGREGEYLGGVELRGRDVLEIGTASGHLCFHMERQGARVVSYDLSPEQSVDYVPYARSDTARVERELKEHIAQTNNAYWLNHRAFGSAARVVYGTVYDIPRALGTFDLATLGSVLLHLRDPFLALQNVLSHTRDTVVITDRSQPSLFRLPLRISDRLGRAIFFRPVAEARDPAATWWRLTPQALRRMIAVLGFEDAEITHHKQLYKGEERELFTLVGRRTVPGGLMSPVA